MGGTLAHNFGENQFFADCGRHRVLFQKYLALRASCKIHLKTEDLSWQLNNSPVAQAFQPVPAQAEACGYILQEALKESGFPLPLDGGLGWG